MVVRDRPPGRSTCGSLWVIDMNWEEGQCAGMSGSKDLTRMTVSLPATQKAYVMARAAASGCSTRSAYIRRLIQADQVAREQEELERKILAGLDSPARVLSPEQWQELRGALRQAQ